MRESLQLRMEDEEQQIRDELSGDRLYITIQHSFMFVNIDSFVALSRDNTSVTEVFLFPFDSNPGSYELWDKVGQIVGNLMELKVINIHFVPYSGTEADDIVVCDDTPDWEILARILLNLRRKVALFTCTKGYNAPDWEIHWIWQGLARAINGHPMISEFSSRKDFTYETVGLWWSALAALPSLESTTLGHQQRDWLNPKLLKQLLRAPALRFVRFEEFYFTNALCHAVASALEEGSLIIAISFDDSCSFFDGGRAIIVNALKRNTSVTDVKFLGGFDEPFFNTFAGVLLANSTLQNLTLQLPEGAGGRWLSSIFLSLGMNTALKSLTANIFDTFGDELCQAISNGLAKNSTLEKLSLYSMHSSGDDGALMARNSLSFLRTNSTLKSLTVSFDRLREGSYVSAFRLETVKMMEDNPFLESLAIVNDNDASSGEFEELSALLSALQRDRTLKTLGFRTGLLRHPFRTILLSDDEVNRLVPILMKNYGLEHFVPDISCADDRIIKVILRLNSVGRRYLIEDESSISKGVDVLSAVSDDINCVFLHLLENPSLCNRRVAETPTSRRRPGANDGESNSSGKRERTQS
jgi:hypothetical protein